VAGVFGAADEPAGGRIAAALAAALAAPAGG
jgi:hypothetical protein